jgi:dephospho-CoA kinase
VILVALTGGIGSGKSSVSSRLAAKGATIVDADAITREVQQPGSEVVAAMAEAFGADILLPDGNLDRAAVAGKVFGDPAALKTLNRIVHPAVNAEMRRQTVEAGERGELVVQDIPLLAESTSNRPQYSGIVVVDVEPDLAVARLMEHRGFTEADARARMTRQASR